MLEIFQYAGIAIVFATSLVGIAKDWSTDHAINPAINNTKIEQNVL
jgi:hypothetical protein